MFPTGKNAPGNIPPGPTLENTIFAAINRALKGFVKTVFGRPGPHVVAVAGDYTAAQVTNVPTAPITSTNVQDAIDELAGLGGSYNVDGGVANSTYLITQDIDGGGA